MLNFTNFVKQKYYKYLIKEDKKFIYGLNPK